MIAVSHLMYMCGRWELARLEKVILENYLHILTTFNEFCKGYKK
jgi:hypothetical protein